MKMSIGLFGLLVAGVIVLGRAWIASNNERKFEERQAQIQKQMSEEDRRTASKLDAMEKEFREESKSPTVSASQETRHIESEADAIVKDEERETRKELGLPATEPSAATSAATTAGRSR